MGGSACSCSYPRRGHGCSRNARQGVRFLSDWGSTSQARNESQIQRPISSLVCFLMFADSSSLLCSCVGMVRPGAVSGCRTMVPLLVSHVRTFVFVLSGDGCVAVVQQFGGQNERRAKNIADQPRRNIRVPFPRHRQRHSVLFSEEASSQR